MAAVVFLDRDGVINKERGDYTYRVADFQFVDDLFESLKILSDKGYQFIVITNQGGISKGIYNHDDVNLVHQYMQEQFKLANVSLLDVLYCPHHTLNEKCICRKPDSLLLEKAIAKHDVAVEKSFMIGDNDRDVEAAKKVGVQGIKVEANESLLNYLDRF